MSLAEKKNEEGKAHLLKAEKCLETSVLKLKFNPDWDSAADEYNKAAICFKVAKNWSASIEAHKKACEGYANSGSLYHAGKQLDQAVLMCKESNDLSEVETLAGRGGLLYRQAGSPESAAQLLVRAAKLLELTVPQNAIGLYEKASETVGTEDRPAEAGQHLETAAKLMVRAKQIDRAAETLHNTMNLYSEAGAAPSAGRVVLSLIVIQIVRGDSVAAAKVLSSWGGFLDGQQNAAANQIIAGFSDLDHDLAKKGLESPALKNLDNDYVKLVRDIELPSASNEDEDVNLC